MKKILLFAFLFSSSFSNAQILIGNASDANSALHLHPMLDCNPQLNTLSFVYTSVPIGGAPKVYTNYSTNSGDTWLNAGAIIFNNNSTVNAPQYPNTFIYNPAGNTIADSSSIHWSSPAGSAGNYVALRYGSTRPAVLPSTVLNTLSVAGSNIPEDGIITQQGECYLLMPPVKSGSISSSDSMCILHGIWDSISRNMVYNTSYLKLPLDLDSNNVFKYRTGGIAFANDSLTGYIYLLAHHEFSINDDSSYYPIIYKTIDGGLTWNTPQVINLNNCNNLLMTSVTGKYSAGFEVDGTVDKNGNLHLVTAVAPLLATNRMDLQGGNWGLFDIYTTDGGTIWYAELINKPQTNNVSYGNLVFTYSRVQVARTWSGSHLFWGWFDTDTLTFGTLSNTHPNLFVKAFNVNSQLWTLTENKTSATNAAALCSFGIIAPYVLEDGVNYELPVTTALGNGSLTSPANYSYLNNILIDSTTFNQTGNPVLLNSTPVAINYSSPVEPFVSDIFPNPASNKIEFYISTNKESVVSYTLLNSQGQLLQTTSNKKIKLENNRFVIDTKLLSNGMYYLQIIINGKTVSRKVIINK